MAGGGGIIAVGALVGREQEILREINRIAGKAKPIRGTLVYKWVKNKAGRRYWYYLHIKAGEPGAYTWALTSLNTSQRELRWERGSGNWRQG